MKFIGRTEEIARLASLAERPGGGLAVVYGRRRIGKTRLLLEWCRPRGGLYAVADQSAERMQLRYFAAAAADRLPALAGAEWPDWATLLKALAREAIRAGFCGPVVLDELPYLVASSPSLPSVLQRWIDHEAREAGLAVAVAGSSRHMMHGLTLAADAPLFGRAAEVLEIRPLPAGQLVEALRFPPRTAVAAFGAFGGIPRYWELLEPFGADIDAAVEALVVDPLGALHEEPDRLLADEAPPATALRPLLDAIGSGAHRVSEIAGRLGLPATSLARPLARLAGLGLVRREQPFGSDEKGGKRALYRIADPLLRLWFRVVAPRRGLLAQAPRSIRRRVWLEARPALLAASFEELCRAAVPRLDRKAIGGVGPWGVASRYWGPGLPEWDVVAASLDGGHLLLGEVKWQERAIKPRDLERAAAALLAKGDPPAAVVQGRQIVRAVFLPEVPRAARSRSFAVSLVGAEEMLEVLR